MPEGGSAPTTKMAIGDGGGRPPAPGPQARIPFGAGLGRNRLQRNKFQLRCNCSARHLGKLDEFPYIV